MINPFGDQKKVNNRSLSQNDYMWGVVYKLISDHTGFTIEEVHEAMKYKFLRKEFFREKPEWPEKLKALWAQGVLRSLASFAAFVREAIMEENKTVYTIGSTRVLTTVEFELYLEKVRLWAAEELEVVIPLPNEISV